MSKVRIFVAWSIGSVVSVLVGLDPVNTVLPVWMGMVGALIAVHFLGSDA